MWNSEVDVAPALVLEPQRIPTDGLERQDNERNANRKQHMVRVEATVHVAEQVSEIENDAKASIWFRNNKEDFTS